MYVRTCEGRKREPAETGQEVHWVLYVLSSNILARRGVTRNSARYIGELCVHFFEELLLRIRLLLYAPCVFRNSPLLFEISLQSVSRGKTQRKYTVEVTYALCVYIYQLFPDSGWSEFFGELKKNSLGRAIRAPTERRSKQQTGVEIFTVSLRQCSRTVCPQHCSLSSVLAATLK